MPDTDNIELGQALPEKKIEAKYVESSDPEAFYRSSSSKGKFLGTPLVLSVTFLIMIH